MPTEPLEMRGPIVKLFLAGPSFSPRALPYEQHVCPSGFPRNYSLELWGDGGEGFT